MCDAKSATITSILSYLQKREREKSKLSVKPPSILRTFVCLCSSSSSSWEDSRGSVGLGLNRRGNIFTGYTKSESCLSRFLSAYEREKWELWTGFSMSACSFYLHRCVLFYIISGSSIQWVTSTFKCKVTWNINHIAGTKEINSTWECRDISTDYGFILTPEILCIQQW